MARNTFQGLLRTTCGRPASVPDAGGLPVNVARMTLAGVIQCRAVDLGANDEVVGMLPAGFMVTGTIDIAAPLGGTVAIILPAHRGLPQVTLRAAAAVSPGARAPITPALTFGIDRPIWVRGVAATRGQAIVGIEGFPIDDASVSSD